MEDEKKTKTHKSQLRFEEEGKEPGEEKNSTQKSIPVHCRLFT